MVRFLLVPFQRLPRDDQVKLSALHGGPKGIEGASICQSLASQYNLPSFAVDSFEFIQLRDSCETF